MSPLCGRVNLVQFFQAPGDLRPTVLYSCRDIVSRNTKVSCRKNIVSVDSWSSLLKHVTFPYTIDSKQDHAKIAKPHAVPPVPYVILLYAQ